MLNTLNTRLDAAIIAFSLDHGEAKVVITDREFSKTMRGRALARAKVKPLVIDYDDPEFSGPGERLGELDYEALLAEGDPDFAWAMPADEWDAIRSTTPPARPAIRRASSTIIAAPTSCAIGNVVTRSMASIPSISGRCRCSTATAGASRGRSPSSPARMCCLR